MDKKKAQSFFHLAGILGGSLEEMEKGLISFLDRVLPVFTGCFSCQRAAFISAGSEPVTLIWPAMLPPEVVLDLGVQELRNLPPVSNRIGPEHTVAVNGISRYLLPLCNADFLVLWSDHELGEDELDALPVMLNLLSVTCSNIAMLTIRSSRDEKVRNEHRLLRTIIDNIPDPVYVKDLEGRKILLNKAEADHLRARSVEEVIGKTDEAFYPDDIAKKTRHEEALIIASGKPAFYDEHLFVSPSGEKIWMEGNKIPYHDAEGKVAGLVGISRDVTSRRKAEQELLENSSKYQSIFTSFLDLYFRSDMNGIILDISPSVFKQSGYMAEEVVGRKADMFYADLQRRSIMMNELMVKGSINDFENILVRKDGIRIPVSITCRMRYNDEGNPEFIEGSIRDISERKTAEIKLSSLLRLQKMMTRMATGFINIPIDVSDQAVNDLLALVGNENEIDRVYIFRYDFKSGFMTNTHEWCATGVNPEIENLKKIPLELFPAWINTHLKGEMLVVPDVDSLAPDDMLRQVLEPQGIKTLVTVPMIFNRECLGFVGFDSVRSVKAWSDEEIAFLQLLADLLCNVTDRKRTEQALKTREAYLKAIFDNVPYHMWLKDTEGKYLLVNQPFLDYFSLTNQDMPIGKTDIELWPPQISQQFIRDDQEVIQSGQLKVVEGELDFNGKKVWFETFRAPILDPNGKLLGTIGIAHDVTARMVADSELKKATKAAQAANIAKTNFLATMSHEIRTPLNAIIGMVRLLLESKVDASQQNLLGNMKTSSESLLSIINDILDFSKIESGQIELSKSDFNLHELVRKVHGSNEYKAEDKGIRFFYTMDQQIGKFYKGDPVRLQQVLNNLVSNALKFTSAGMVELKIELSETKGAIDRLMFTVEDTGIGISPENQEKIFNSFQQEDETITRNYGGTGLGLAISKQLVELMGGNLGLESYKDRGSRFFFTIDMESGKAASPRSSPEPQQEQKSALKGARVLLVEDNKFNQFIAQAILEKWGALIVIAEDGQEAVNKMRTDKYDLVLMDLQMPVMDGITAATIIRNELGIQTPILALTANVVKGIAERCQEAGMQGYISKPFDEEDLYQQIISMLNLSVQIKVDAPSPPVMEPHRLADVSRLSRMVNHDKRTLGMMIQKFIDVTPEYVEDLKTAAEKRDIEGIQAMSHKLKSAVDLVSDESMRSLIKSINETGKTGKESEDLYEKIGVFTRNYQDLIKQLKLEIPSD